LIIILPPHTSTSSYTICAYTTIFCSTVALQPSAGYVLLWLCSPVQSMASCGSAAHRRLWPPVALQPSASYGLLWFCSPVQAMASCGSAAQRGLWPRVALQPSADCGHLWLCSTARTVASFTRFHDHTQRRATVGRNLWMSDQPVAETST
jgi:hypothetical protein